MLAVARFERLKCSEESICVRVVDFDERIDIERGDRRALEHRRDTADDDVLDAVALKQLQIRRKLCVAIAAHRIEKFHAGLELREALDRLQREEPID